MKNRDRNLKCYRKDQRSNISNTLFQKYSILLALKLCLQMCFQNHNPPILEVTTGLKDSREGLRFYTDQCLCISIWKRAFERLQNRKKSYLLLLQYMENSSKLGRIPADTVTAPVWWKYRTAKGICQICASWDVLISKSNLHF